MATTKTAIPHYPERSTMQKSRYRRLKLDRLKNEQFALEDQMYNVLPCSKRYDHAAY